MKSLRCTLGHSKAFILFAFTSVVAYAAPSGETVFGQFGNFAPCSQIDDASVAITVDVPSRLLVSIAGSVKNTVTTNAYTVTFHPELMNATGTTVLATNQGIIETDPTATFQAFSDTEVLVDATSGGSYTLAPGNYVLKLTFTMGGSCNGAGPFFRNSVLTYVLLSSAQDRIFASGLNAMNVNRPVKKQFVV
jgi:hypothetical protein